MVGGVKPTLIKEVTSSDGKSVATSELNDFINKKLGFEPENQKDLNISKQNLDAIYEGMRSVTGDQGGTAYSIFREFEIEVAGKTGSAQAGNKTNGWFVGFAPYEDPQIAVVVIVENAQHGNYTAEVVLKIMEEYFKINNNEVNENTQMEPMETVIN